MKQAYERYASDYWFDYREIELLPKCKKVINPHGTFEYQLVSRKLFGWIPIKYWVDKKDIHWFDKSTTEYYDCSCGEE